MNLVTGFNSFPNVNELVYIPVSNLIFFYLYRNFNFTFMISFIWYNFACKTRLGFSLKVQFERPFLLFFLYFLFLISVIKCDYSDNRGSNYKKDPKAKMFNNIHANDKDYK